MNVNPFGLNSVYTKTNPSTMNANQSCGLHFGAGSGDYDCYQSSVPKKKENFWQKWKKWIIGGTVAVGAGILGIVGYNKGWFGKAKEAVKALPKTEPSKPGNDFEMDLKTLGLSDGTIEGGTKIADLLKKTNEVTTNQFIDVAKEINEKIKHGTSSNDVNTAAVTILEQLRKNLTQDAAIEGFDISKEINNINVLGKIITTSEPGETPAEVKPEKKVNQTEQSVESEQSVQSAESVHSAESVQPESVLSGPTNQADELPNESSQIDISGSAVQQPTIETQDVQPAQIYTDEQREVVNLLRENYLNGNVINALLGDDEKVKENIIKDNADGIAWDLCDVIKKNKIKDNATFKFLIQDLLTKVNEKKDEFINDETRNGIGYLLEQVIINKDSFGIDNNILSSLVDQVCPRENGTIKKATGGTIACLAVAIKQGLINDKNLAFEADVIPQESAHYIAGVLFQASEDDNLKNNDAFKSLVKSFHKTCLTQEGVITQNNAGYIFSNLATAINQGVIDGEDLKFGENVITEDNVFGIAEALSKASEDDSLKGNNTFKSFVKSFYETYLTQEGVITQNNAGDIFSNLATAINQGVIDSEELKFGENVITEDNVFGIAETLSKASEDNSLKGNNTLKTLVKSFYNKCLTKKDVITKDNAGDIFSNLATAIDQGVIDKDLFKDGVITQYNVVGIAGTLSKASEDDSLKGNDTFKSIVTSFYKACLTQEGVITKDNVDNIFSNLTTAIKQCVINGEDLKFGDKAITKDNVFEIGSIFYGKEYNLKGNDTFKSIVTSFYKTCLTQEGVITQNNVNPFIIHLVDAINQSIIDDKDLKFGDKAITNTNAGAIAKGLYKQYNSLANNSTFKSLIQDLLIKVNEKKEEFINDETRDGIGYILKQVIINKDSLDISDDILSSLVDKVYSRENGTIKATGGTIACLGAVIKNKLIEIPAEKMPTFEDSVITKDNAVNIAQELTELIDEDSNLKANPAFKSLVASFYNKCLTQSGLISKNNANEIIPGLVVAIKQGFINDKDLKFKDGVITKDNAVNIAQELTEFIDEDSDLKTNPAFKFLVNDFLKKIEAMNISTSFIKSLKRLNKD